MIIIDEYYTCHASLGNTQLLVKKCEEFQLGTFAKIIIDQIPIYVAVRLLTLFRGRFFNSLLLEAASSSL